VDVMAWHDTCTIHGPNDGHDRESLSSDSVLICIPTCTIHF
jgi:hypothetical protein